MRRSLPGESLTGQLPLDASVWGALPAVQSLDLKGNALNGYVPPQLSGMAGAQSLDLSSNQLQGPLPPLANMSALESVSFSNNQLTGAQRSSVSSFSAQTAGVYWGTFMPLGGLAGMHAPFWQPPRWAALFNNQPPRASLLHISCLGQRPKQVALHGRQQQSGAEDSHLANGSSWAVICQW